MFIFSCSFVGMRSAGFNNLEGKFEGSQGFSSLISLSSSYLLLDVLYACDEKEWVTRHCATQHDLHQHAMEHKYITLPTCPEGARTQIIGF